MPHINGYNIFIYIIICIIIQIMVSFKDNNILANFILADNLAKFLCYNIRQHDMHILECNTWYRLRTHKSAKFRQVKFSISTDFSWLIVALNVCELYTKYGSLMSACPGRMLQYRYLLSNNIELTKMTLLVMPYFFDL